MGSILQTNRVAPAPTLAAERIADEQGGMASSEKSPRGGGVLVVEGRDAFSCDAGAEEGRPAGASMSDIELIDEIGVSRIAKALGISKQGVRKWRKTGIPEARKEALFGLLDAIGPSVAPGGRRIAPAMRERANAATRPAARSAATTTPPKPRHVAPKAPAMRDASTSGRSLAEMNAFIAARNVDHARAHAERTAAEAMGLPPVYPVRGYKSRLAMLFALDFPILTMAFVAVTQASPIVAAGSAIALSLFLVLGAHSLGGPLRELARHVPAWGRHLATVVIMLLLLASVIGVTVDLRIKGFDVEGLLLGDGGRGGVFGDRIDSADTLPEPFRWAIVRAAGLVTLLATVFGISWSYRQHSPQAAFARAEVAYQRALRRHARSMRRLPRKVAATIVATAAIILAAVADVKAAACSGPTVLALVDTTTAYDDQDRAAIMPAVEVMVSSLPAKSRLTIRTVRDAASSSRLLFDACTPVDGHMTWNLAGLWRWLINDPATLRIERVRFIDGIRDVLIPEFHGQGDAERTALIDTLAHHAGEVDRLSAIWLFTDLLESVALPMDALLSSSASLHDGGQSLPPLSGVDVHVAGIGRFHDRARRPLSQRELGALIGAWTDVIQAAGGTLHLEGQT